MTPKAHFIFLSDFWIINTFARSRGVLMADVLLFYCQLPAERPHAAGRAPVPHPAPAWNAVRHCDARRRGRRLQVKGGRGGEGGALFHQPLLYTSTPLDVYMFTCLQAPGGSQCRPVRLHWRGRKTATATPNQPEAEERHDCGRVERAGARREPLLRGPYFSPRWRDVNPSGYQTLSAR